MFPKNRSLPFYFHVLKKYSKIWALDEQNPLIGPDGGESVEDVATRMYKVIQRIEMECQG